MGWAAEGQEELTGGEMGRAFLTRHSMGHENV